MVYCSIATTYGQLVDIVATPQTTTLNVGETTTILIQAEAGSQEVNNVQLVINFNKNELEVVGNTVTPGTQFAGISLNRIIQNPNDNNLSQIQFSGDAGPASSITGTFDVFSMEVKALAATNLSEFTYVITDNPRSKVSFGFDSDLIGTTIPIGITVNTTPTIEITGPADNADIPRAEDITFTAVATDVEDDDSTLQITWEPEAIFVTNDTGSTITTKLLLSGTQTITVIVTDSNGATNTSSITINVADPELTITAPTEGSVLNSKEVVFELMPEGMDISDHFHFYINPADVNNLTAEERINTTDQPGATTFTYTEMDNIIEGENTVVIAIANTNHLEFANTKTVLSFIVDSTPPEITLNGDNPLELNLNDTYNEPGATATDARDGAINTIVIDESDIDTSQMGTYTVTYEATDAAGNTGMTTRTVNVSTTLSADNPNTSATNIRLYPNPTSDKLFIQLAENNRLEEVAIYTIDGKRIKTIEKLSRDQQIKIDVSTFTAGLYLFTAKIGDDTFFKRFSVE